MNFTLRRAVVAPMTTQVRTMPSRIDCEFQGVVGQIAVDQIRSVDHRRFVKRLGRLDGRTAGRLLRTLNEFFSP